MIEAQLLDIGFVVGELIEGDVLIKMVVDVGRAGSYRIRLGSEPLLPVDVATDIVRQRAVVLLIPVVEILADALVLSRIEAGDLILLRRGIDDLDREALITQLLDLGTLLIIPLEAHTEGQDAVVAVELIDIPLLQLVIAYVLIVIGEDDPRRLIAGEVHQGDARRRPIASPDKVGDEGDKGEGNPSEEEATQALTTGCRFHVTHIAYTLYIISASCSPQTRIDRGVEISRQSYRLQGGK